ncbi:hypothetical protein BN7_4308 [Wickerhamomyces ciferrii]|uniref:U4/U6.U5 small nuclear ribonucleoprotein 27kDa protein domain-containing protein n=1 Tax=Wickerhamomyces ciferrii (strain ATCC 14091 / BCRC 22168 / CBS 111 / JCM 3599 / NBRC 0793 / NRRL Y-1031 F-60-10) TaxID=1206466 RepID=K0KHR0_WICCF|nr:uncharacterized protein BN7_4308 [Wickerhamomyces ciferrii]CCH44740.1 hypothetical protein BN7_4308 [Wickerhamomyces ciferrii]
MSEREFRPSRDHDVKIKSRNQSMSPNRLNKSAKFRDRSRDRSHDRSSIISNGKPSEKPKRNDGDDTEEKDLKTQDERGRSSSRKADEPQQEGSNDNGQDMMMQLMGFGSFESTKGKHVAGVGSGTAKKNKKAQFRQYMNRDKGFNRNLSPERSKKK